MNMGKLCIPKLLSPEELKSEYLQNKNKPVWVEIVKDNKCDPVVERCYLVDFGGVASRIKAEKDGITQAASWIDNMVFFCNEKNLRVIDLMHDGLISDNDLFVSLIKFSMDSYNTRPFGFRCWSAEPTIRQRKNSAWVVGLDYSPESKGLIRFFYGENPAELEDPCEGCRRASVNPIAFPHCDKCEAINCMPGFVVIEYMNGLKADCAFFLDSGEAADYMSERYYDMLFDLHIVEIEHNDNPDLYLKDDCASVLFTDRNGEKTDLYLKLVKPICHIDSDGECQFGVYPCHREDEIISVLYQHNDDIECHLFASTKDALLFMRRGFYDKLFSFEIDMDKYGKDDVLINENEAFIQIDGFNNSIDLDFSWIITPVTNLSKQESID